MPDSENGYAGDVSARFTWDQLAAPGEATLIDVRTRAEWTYVGVPDLSQLGKPTLFVAWDEFPSGQIVPGFIDRLTAALDEHGVPSGAPLFFLCRSGARSQRAALAATGAGFGPCFNVEFGFEGRLGPERHRATAGSWKAEGLPWVQS